MASFLSKVTSAVAACARRVTRATRRLLRPRRLRRGGSICLGRLLVPSDGDSNGAGDCEENGGQGLWRRAILLGERCEPLDFPGAIHYDSLGRRLQAPRSGSGKAAALFCRSSDAVDEAVAATKKDRYA